MRHNLVVAIILVFGLIGAIRSYSDGNSLFMNINVNNEGAKDLEGLKASVYIYDLDIVLQTSPFDLDNGDTRGNQFFWDIPKGAKHGTYLARITVSNDDVKKVKHRLITI